MMREYSARTQHELNETQQATACDYSFFDDVSKNHVRTVLSGIYSNSRNS